MRDAACRAAHPTVHLRDQHASTLHPHTRQSGVSGGSAHLVPPIRIPSPHTSDRISVHLQRFLVQAAGEGRVTCLGAEARPQQVGGNRLLHKRHPLS